MLNWSNVVDATGGDIGFLNGRERAVFDCDVLAPAVIVGHAVIEVANTATSAGTAMARWPDDTRSIVTTLALVFVVFPLLCLFAYWFIHG